MVEFTVPFVHAVVEELEPSRIASPSEEDFWNAVEKLEEVEAMLDKLPVSKRREAVSDIAVERDDVLWIPTSRNCRMSVGVAVDPEGYLTFAVGDEGRDSPLANYFSARTAVARALYNRKGKIASVPSAAVEKAEITFDTSLIEYIRASGWAVPVARRTDDLAPEILARFARLSEQGVAHLFFEGGGFVLAMAGSTVRDRINAVERLSTLPARSAAPRRTSGVLLCASETGTHYSEKENWGISVGSEKVTADAELRDAAVRFRASRQGSLAVAETDAERRRIESNRKRLRAEFIARRRSGEELVVRSAREIDALRRETTYVHWIEEPEFRRLVESRHRTGRAAYDTARAVYLQRLPTVAHKLLHLLRRVGKPVDETEFLSRHRKLCDVESLSPEVELGAALRDLSEAGKVRRLRSRESGAIFIVATQALDRRRLQQDLDRTIHDPNSGIPETRASIVAAEPDDEYHEEAAFVEETGHEVLLGMLADETAEEELEGAVS